MLVPVLLPLRRLGQRPRRRRHRLRGDAEDDRLHADRLAADAGGGDRHRDPLRPRRPPHLLDRRTEQAPALQTAASAGSSGSSPPPSWSRCPPSCCTAGCQTPTAPRRCRPWPSSPGCSPRSAPTGFLRDRAAALPRGNRAVPGGAAGDRAGLDPLRLGDGLHPDQRAADRRLLLGRPARLHHRRDLRPARRRRRRRDPADGQPRPRRRPDLHHRRDPRTSEPGPRTCERWAGWRCAPRCWRRSF